MSLPITAASPADSTTLGQRLTALQSSTLWFEFAGYSLLAMFGAAVPGSSIPVSLRLLALANCVVLALTAVVPVLRSSRSGGWRPVITIGRSVAGCVTIFLLSAMLPQHAWLWAWTTIFLLIYSLTLPRTLAVANAALYAIAWVVGGRIDSGGVMIATVLLLFIAAGAGQYVGHLIGRVEPGVAMLDVGRSTIFTVAEQGAEPSLVADVEWRVLYANRPAGQWLSVSGGELVGRLVSDLIDQGDLGAFVRATELAVAAPLTAQTATVRIGAVPSRRRLTDLRIVNLLHDPSVRAFVVHFVDAEPGRMATLAVEREREVLRTVFDAIPLSLYTKDLSGRFVSSNRANLERLALANQDDLLGKTAAELVRPELARQCDEYERLVAASGRVQCEPPFTGLLGPDDRRWFEVTHVPLHAADGPVTGLLGIVTDVTERKESESRLVFQAAHDALTGLPNRRNLVERLHEMIDEARAGNTHLALIFCDLDFFKAINDMHGHELGDQVLRSVAASISASLRPTDWIARFGGDEFVIVCRPIHTVDEGMAIAERLLDSVSREIHVGELALKVDASFGVAFLRPEHSKASELIRDADAAMYLAKEKGRHRIAVFDDALRQRTVARSKMDQALRYAVERNELFLMYQPKVSLQTGKLCGFEALMRWRSAQGLISPVEFIPLAEESGTIIQLGHWALRAACRQLRQWQNDYPALDDLTVAVNVSVRQLFQDGFVESVQAIIDEFGIYPSALELEITESAAMSNPAQAVRLLSDLKRSGVRIALDDFGTGYSSLAHLQKLPIDVLKIDRAFVNGLGERRENAEIAKLVIALAKTLNLETVAEGVETTDDMRALQKLQADIAQGYLFSRPMSVNEAEQQLRIGSPYLV
ncbi:putative bifunctional diguanylate cyclase/phosphodiesterase [Derxia gummosa]|uniref:Bifunctional diguanylate cyclase/phosphodiesterase n=1 Tax=Derxia gummosa DSM 723 TaxID=1121388 RepID=A0A8B6XCE6_9BURK|nr:EAL domain-containing protein [Derxia gummosa]